MFKIIIQFVFISFLIFFNNCNCDYSKNIKLINIYYIDWDMESPICVDCDNFNQYFIDVINIITITDDSTCNSFLSKVNQIKSNDTINIIPDVRIKIEIIFTSGKSNFLCIGNNNVISINDEICVYDEAFIIYVKNMILNKSG